MQQQPPQQQQQAADSNASRIIGRRVCPWCAFEHAHVKQKPAGRPYHYCPQCGFKALSHNAEQQRLLTIGMRPEPNYAAVPQLARRADDIVLSPAAVAELRTPAGPWDQLLNLFNIPRPSMFRDPTTPTPLEQLRQAMQTVDADSLHPADLARGLVAAVAVIEDLQHQINTLAGE